MAAWVDIKILASSPCGCFVDVYSFLDRVLQVSGELKDLEIYHKLRLSGDEALTLSRFMREVSRIFGKDRSPTSSSLETYSKPSLPALPTSDYLDIQKTHRRLCENIKRKMINVKYHIQTNIGLKFKGSEVVKLVAQIFLDNT